MNSAKRTEIKNAKSKLIALQKELDGARLDKPLIGLDKTLSKQYTETLQWAAAYLNRAIKILDEASAKHKDS